MRRPEITLHCGDCLDVMGEIADGSIDLILCDLPYGTTACKWDSVIPFEPLWAHYRRLLKPRGAVVLTASQPFTSALVMSNLQWFKYEWVWVKNRPTNFAHAKNKPMKKHENIVVFAPGTTNHASRSDKRMNYFPQGVVQVKGKTVTKRLNEKTDAFFPDRPGHREFVRSEAGYPHSVLTYSTDRLGLHPTAKPVDMMEYLIHTYSHEGETVLDNCMGSGTTGVACINTGRNFVGIELKANYFDIARKRISTTPTPLFV